MPLLVTRPTTQTRNTLCMMELSLLLCEASARSLSLPPPFVLKIEYHGENERSKGGGRKYNQLYSLRPL